MDDKTDDTSVQTRDPTTEYYCVIGPSVTQNHPIKRSWKTSQEDAVKHAEKLIRNSFDGQRSKVAKLLVVKVVEVVELTGPPITRRSIFSIEPTLRVAPMRSR